MLQRSVGEEWCREVLEKSVVDRGDVEGICCREELEKRVAQTCSREVLGNGVEETFWGRVL